MYMYYIHMTYSSASAIVLFYFLLLLLLFVPLLFNSSITRWHCLHVQSSTLVVALCTCLKSTLFENPLGWIFIFALIFNEISSPCMHR